jgi:hypothetical protein
VGYSTVEYDLQSPSDVTFAAVLIVLDGTQTEEQLADFLSVAAVNLKYISLPSPQALIAAVAFLTSGEGDGEPLGHLYIAIQSFKLVGTGLGELFGHIDEPELGLVLQIPHGIKYQATAAKTNTIIISILFLYIFYSEKKTLYFSLIFIHNNI